MILFLFNSVFRNNYYSFPYNKNDINMLSNYVNKYIFIEKCHR